MSGSNKANDWENTVYTQKTFVKNEVYYQEWNNTKPYQCFRFQHYGETTCTQDRHHYSVDVSKIEFYGTIFPLNSKPCETLYIKNNFNTFIILTFIFIYI